MDILQDSFYIINIEFLEFLKALDGKTTIVSYLSHKDSYGAFFVQDHYGVIWSAPGLRGE